MVSTQFQETLTVTVFPSQNLNHQEQNQEQYGSAKKKKNLSE